MNNETDLLIWVLRFGLVFLAVAVVAFGLSRCVPVEELAAPTTREFTLKDGTRCVAIGDKALVCDFAKPGY